MRRSFYILFILLILGSSCVRRKKDGVSGVVRTRLKIASAYNSSLPILGDSVKKVGERLELASGGSIKVKLLGFSKRDNVMISYVLLTGGV